MIPKIQGDVPSGLNYIGALFTFDPAGLKSIITSGTTVSKSLAKAIESKEEFVHCVTRPGCTNGHFGIERSATFMPKSVFDANKGDLNKKFFIESHASGLSIDLHASYVDDRFQKAKISAVKNKNIWDCDYPQHFKTADGNPVAIPALRRKVFPPTEPEDTVQKTVLGLMLVTDKDGTVIPSIAWGKKPDESGYDWHPYNEPLREILRFSRPRTRSPEAVSG